MYTDADQITKHLAKIKSAYVVKSHLVHEQMRLFNIRVFNFKFLILNIQMLNTHTVVAINFLLFYI